MRIFVDGDACPNAIKEILYRAAFKRVIELYVVANTYQTVPKGEIFRMIVVSEGPDMADDKIVEMVEPDDLVVTADIPLADRVVTKGAFAINPRGDFYTEENIKQRLSMRNFMDELRSSGIETGGPSSFNAKDKQAFANSLDRFISKQTTNK